MILQRKKMQHLPQEMQQESWQTQGELKIIKVCSHQLFSKMCFTIRKLVKYEKYFSRLLFLCYFSGLTIHKIV